MHVLPVLGDRGPYACAETHAKSCMDIREVGHAGVDVRVYVRADTDVRVGAVIAEAETGIAIDSCVDGRVGFDIVRDTRLHIAVEAQSGAQSKPKAVSVVVIGEGRSGGAEQYAGGGNGRQKRAKILVHTKRG